jgi:hypothetical protein
MARDPVRLSEKGEARREAILGMMAGAQRRRRSRRMVGRAAAGVALMMAGVAVWAAVRTAPGPGRPALPLVGPVAPEVSNEFAAVRIEIVRNDPAVVARYSEEGSGLASVIGDEELEGMLRRAGRPPGHIRTPDRFILASDIALPKGPIPGSG